jgi:group I intron endonuclease
MAYSGTVYRIYILTNVVNGKQYVGITNSLEKRWNKHKNAKGSAPALHAAIKKYGVSNFVFTHFADAFDGENAKIIEQMLIADHNTMSPHGYNLTAGGDGTLMPAEEVKKKMSDSHKGKTQSDITKQKRSESLKKAYAEGRHKGSKNSSWSLSNEHKKRLSKSKMGDKNPMFGKKQSEELIAKRTAAFAIAIAKRKAETA